jgi:uncharacterized membrane protein YeaQ/YmgE (transglycosylase-associated protein family)
MILVLLVVLVALFVVLPLIGLALWAVVSTVIVGLVIGALARLVIPGTQPIGVLATVLAGLSGSIIGGFLGQHVWGIGHLGTILIEIAIAAVVVLGLSTAQRRQVPGGRA